MSSRLKKIHSVGTGLETEKMPGHLLLARLGKRVLRPGGRALTERLIEAVSLGPGDRVVEFGPGLGSTAGRILSLDPESYTGVERDVAAAEATGAFLDGETRRCVVASAEATGLSDGEATVVFGEAVLTMQREQRKREIVAESWRLLAPGGRVALHELAFVPDGIDPVVEGDLADELSRAIHVGARPLTPADWERMLTERGFSVAERILAPMALLSPRRVLEDEGLGALRIGLNLLRDRGARQRVTAMRRTFRAQREHLAAIGIVAVKPRGEAYADSGPERSGGSRR